MSLFWETAGLRRCLIAVLLAATFTAPAGAQLQTGNLYGLVLDNTSTPLAGATVVLTGGGAPQEQKSDAQGAFRFISLAPGSYSLVAALQGYTTMEFPALTINVGRNSQIEITLQAAVAESITVTTEAPLLDERRVATGTNIERTELEKIPTTRDPWALLSSVPGVLTDRINVGGNYSGTQSSFVGPGSPNSQAVWSLDGMVITDMTAIGTSPGYFDFDSFEDVQVTTGGSDASLATGGVAINMVTRRGTNDWRGSAHAYYSDESFVSGLNLDQNDLAKKGPANNNHAQPSFQGGNRIHRVQDTGLEAGGPLLRDHLWVWGSYTRPKIDLFTIEGYEDNTDQTAWNLKLNGQINPANSATFFAWNDEKDKTGLGAGLLRQPESTWNQSRFGPRPTALKLEDNQIFGSSFYLTGLVSKVNGGVQYLPAGSLDAAPFQDDDLVWHNSYFIYQSSRPQRQARLDGSQFFNTGRLSHELKFGAGYRVVEVNSLTRTPGGGFGCCGGLLIVARDSNIRFRGKYTSAFLQDTLTAGRVTANLGVRYDLQQGRNLPTTLRANPALPDFLPSVSDPGGPIGFQWRDIVPRLGLTWAVDEQRRTLLRASYSRYADQLDTGNAGWLDPLQVQQYVYFYTANPGSPVINPDDLIGPPTFTSGINPVTHGILQSRALDPDLQAPAVDEVILGLDRALLPELVVGLQGVYKHYTRLLDTVPLVFDDPDAYSDASLASVGRKIRRDDYVPAGSVTATGPDGQPHTITYYQLRPGVSTRGGAFLENGRREQVYKALMLTLNKRLADRWMLRGNYTWQDWRWRIPKGAVTDANPALLGGTQDGSLVVAGRDFAGGGALGNVFINSKWSYSLNALYQVAPDRPWGFNLAASLTGRQGYPIRYVRRVFIPGLNIGRPSDLPLSTRVDAFRYPDVHVLNLRADKDFRFRRGGVNVGLDIFNALNRATVLQRQIILGRNNGDYVTELLGQRVYRLSLRLEFR